MRRGICIAGWWRRADPGRAGWSRRTFLTRTVTVFDLTDSLADTDWHPYAAAIIRVERDLHTRNAKAGLPRHSSETAFYVPD